MNVFKRVKELEEEVERLRGVERELDAYKKQLIRTEEDLRDILTLKDNIPEDCRPGPYCKGCSFVKKYYYDHNVFSNCFSPGYHNIITGYMCNKANFCKNFVQEEK